MIINININAGSCPDIFFFSRAHTVTGFKAAMSAVIIRLREVKLLEEKLMYTVYINVYMYTFRFLRGILYRMQKTK